MSRCSLPHGDGGGVRALQANCVVSAQTKKQEQTCLIKEKKVQCGGSSIVSKEVSGGR